MDNEKYKSSAKRIAVIALIMTFSSIVLAVILDLVAFKDVVLQFIAALIMPCIAFVFLFILMLASIILIFGIYLLKQEGFWPLKLSFQFFKEIIGDIKVTPEQINTFRAFRIILLVLCVSIFVLSIVARIMSKKDKEQGQNRVVRSVKGLTTTSIVFAILGIIISLGALAITSSI